MNMIRILMTISIVIGATFFTGCTTADVGTLQLKITDAPGDLNITEALVTISSIEVHIAAGGNNSSAEWVTIISEPQQFDLILLENVTDVLGRLSNLESLFKSKCCLIKNE